MSKRGDPWFKFYPQDWIDGTRKLSLEQRGAYIDMIAIQMLSDDAVPDDYAWLAHQMHVSKRKAQSIVESLIDCMKIRRTDAGLVNGRAEDEIEKRRHQREVNITIAVERERARAEQRAAGGDSGAAQEGTSSTVQSRTDAESPVKLQRVNRENPAKTARKPNEKQEYTNKNNEAGANSCNEDSTTRAGGDTDTEGREVRDNPPTPLAGGASATGFKLDGEPSAKRKLKAIAADVQQAFEVYNVAANHFGFSRCESLTASRSTRLAKRLADIGGIEKFKGALRALARDEPFAKFLLGKARARAGDDPFKLSLDRLLQTEGGLGDVLAQLCDIAAAGGAAVERAKSLADNLRALSDEQQAALVREKANGIWPMNVLLYPPGHKLCVIRPEAYRMAGIDEQTYDVATGMRRGGNSHGH